MKSAWDSNYWNERFLTKDTPWDAGKVTTPIKEYADQLSDKSLKILIPGCGNAYEAEYLHEQGFKNVFLIDISLEAISLFNKRVPDFPKAHIFHEDFFEHSGTYDLIIEQTFFCAIDPGLRPAYAKKTAELLNKGGKLMGLLFNDKLNSDKPPFGGDLEEYKNYFQPYFKFVVFETAYNSIKPRAGREVFILLEKL